METSLNMAGLGLFTFYVKPEALRCKPPSRHVWKAGFVTMETDIDLNSYQVKHEVSDFQYDVCSSSSMDQSKMDKMIMSGQMLTDSPPNAKEPRRRKKVIDKEKLFCVICGDKAMGYNFGAVTCESCKAFFRRNALKTKQLECSFGGNCKIDPFTRKFCTKCRLEKCLSMNMKKEWILDDDALKKRRDRQVQQKQMQMHTQMPSCTSTSGDDYLSPTSTSAGFNMDASVFEMQAKRPRTFSSSTTPSPSSVSMMSGLENVQYQTQMSASSDDELMDYSIPLSEHYAAEVASIRESYFSVIDAPYPENTNHRFTDKPKSHSEMFNMADGFIRRLIKFTKTIEEFRMLTQEDQIALLKGGIMEILALRSALSFDKNAMGYKYRDKEGSHNLKMTLIQQASGQEHYHNHVRFVTTLNSLAKWDKVTMILLFVIELFSPDRPNIVRKDIVTTVQEKFSDLLKMYLESQYPLKEARLLYPKLLLKLTDVRNLGEGTSRLAERLNSTSLEPLLAEIFNLS